MNSWLFPDDNNYRKPSISTKDPLEYFKVISTKCRKHLIHFGFGMLYLIFWLDLFNFNWLVWSSVAGCRMWGLMLRGNSSGLCWVAGCGCQDERWSQVLGIFVISSKWKSVLPNDKHSIYFINNSNKEQLEKV